MKCGVSNSPVLRNFSAAHWKQLERRKIWSKVGHHVQCIRARLRCGTHSRAAQLHVPIYAVTGVHMRARGVFSWSHMFGSERSFHRLQYRPQARAPSEETQLFNCMCECCSISQQFVADFQTMDWRIITSPSVYSFAWFIEHLLFPSFKDPRWILNNVHSHTQLHTLLFGIKAAFPRSNENISPTIKNLTGISILTLFFHTLTLQRPRKQFITIQTFTNNFCVYDSFNYRPLNSNSNIWYLLKFI